jgi:hypothetical protein
LDSSLVVVASMVLIGVALLAPMLLARRRAPQEQGLTPTFETTCSGTYNSYLRSNIPMLRLSIYSDFLVIGFLRPTVIPFGDLTSVEVRRGFIGRRLYISTQKGTTYQLSVWDPDKVALLLRHT